MKRMPIVGDVIKGLGWIIEIMNEDGKEKFWGDEVAIKFLGWNDAYHGTCSTVMREIDEDDVCTPEQRRTFFARSRGELIESITYLEEDVALIDDQENNEAFLLEVTENGKRVFEYVMTRDMKYHYALIHHDHFEKLLVELINDGRHYSHKVGVTNHVLEDGSIVEEPNFEDRIMLFETPQSIYEHLKRICDCKLLEYR